VSMLEVIPRTREMIGEQVQALIEDGDAVVAWDAATDAGFTLRRFSRNRRMPVALFPSVPRTRPEFRELPVYSFAV
jgi:hypothetical protein